MQDLWLPSLPSVPNYTAQEQKDVNNTTGPTAVFMEATLAVLSVWQVKDKVCYTWGAEVGCSSPFLTQSVSMWINHWSVWTVTYGKSSTRAMVTFPATGHHCPLTNTKLCCLMREANVHEQPTQGLLQQPGLLNSVSWLFKIAPLIDKCERYSCKIFSEFNIPKINKVGQFLTKLFKKIKKVDVFETQCICQAFKYTEIVNLLSVLSLTNWWIQETVEILLLFRISAAKPDTVTHTPPVLVCMPVKKWIFF